MFLRCKTLHAFCGASARRTQIGHRSDHEPHLGRAIAFSGTSPYGWAVPSSKLGISKAVVCSKWLSALETRCSWLGIYMNLLVVALCPSACSLSQRA
eukprot:165870-Pelagomonas_calceolata.AAC.3